MSIELVVIAEGFDMANPYAQAMAHVASVFADPTEIIFLGLPSKS